MEVVQGGRRARREISPERGKSGMRVEAKMMSSPTFKKVQIVYYLSRNGHLEHPHYMEVTHLVHQQLRLKDVMDRLTVLRGKGMPSLYSWSCKRSYKNGFVWNDLAPNDVIYPSEGAEYVLKGSELIEGTTEKLCHLQIGNVPLGSGHDSRLMQPKHKSSISKRFEIEEMTSNGLGQEEDEEEYEEKTSYTSSTTRSTPRSRRSRGISTDDIEEFKQPKASGGGGTAEFSLEPNPFSSPPSTTSSTLSEKANNDATGAGKAGNSKISDDVGNEPLLSRNSLLLSLISCGGSASFRKAGPPPETARKSAGTLHKGVVCKAAAKVAVDVNVDEDELMIGSMSENPRFGNLQSEEKEYFSGSIVEGMAKERIEAAHGFKLKKSSSHNEEKSGRSGLGEAGDQEEVQKRKEVKGKCMPMKKSSYIKQSKK